MPPTKSGNRPALLIAVMWVLLAASIAGAAMLVHLKSGLWRIALTEPQKIGSVEVRLPVGWEVDYTRRGASEFVEASESGPPGRRLSIRATDSDERIGPMDFLLNSDLVRLMTLEREDVRLVEDLEVPGGSGFVIHPKKGPALGVITFADGRAVTIQLTSASGSSGDDDAIIYHVANSVRLGERPAEMPARRGTGREI